MNAEIDRQEQKGVKPSDHAPVVAAFEQQGADAEGAETAVTVHPQGRADGGFAGLEGVLAVVPLCNWVAHGTACCRA